MLWNFFMHAFIGFLGPTFFTLTPEGIGLAILVVLCTQGADQFRIKREMLIRINALPENEREAAMEKFNASYKEVLLFAFVKNTVLFTIILLVSADISRTMNWMASY